MPLQIYNSLSGKNEKFNPVHEGQASLYVCGPTVYGDSHLGHAKAYVSFDIIPVSYTHLTLPTSDLV